jgi:nicotinamide-nucleotide amidase
MVLSAMAEGAIRNSHADIAVSVTGIAGPDGGSEGKPVGTVCFAWLHRGMDAHTARIVFQGDRLQVRQQANMMAIQGLIDLVGI